MTHKKTQTTKIHAQTRPPTQHGTNHQRSALTTLTGNHTTNTPTRKNSHQSIHREPNTQFSIFILDTLLDTQPPHPHPNNQPEKPVNHQKERKPTLPQKTPNHKPTRPATSVPRQVVGRFSLISKLGMVGSANPRCTSAGRFHEIASWGRVSLYSIR